MPLTHKTYQKGIVLPLQEVSRLVPELRLEKITYEMTPELIEYYDDIGWSNFSQSALEQIVLPSLGEPLCFSEKFSIQDGLVAEIRGNRFKIIYSEDGIAEAYEVQGKQIQLIPTQEPLSVPDAISYHREHRLVRKAHSFYLQLFGQPNWVQMPMYPADSEGNPCFHLLTIENGWGDCGNFNIVVGMRDDLPFEAYLIAACC